MATPLTQDAQPPPARRRLLALSVLLTALITVNVAAVVSRIDGVWAPGATDAAMSTASTPWIGLIAPTSQQTTSLAHTSVTRMTLSAAWDRLEPSPGVFNPAATNALRTELSTLQHAGYQVILDLGLQYPPAWVFALPGSTRFVNQFGDSWHGVLSTDVPNSVFNQYVRAAEASYIHHLGSILGSSNISSIRVGGLLSGELRYPPSSYMGHKNLIWDYDSAAKTRAPFPSWRPGAGTAAQASASLQYYFNSLTNYEIWLMSRVDSAFPAVNQEMMFPSWGLRPGMTQAAISAGMHGTTNAEVNGMISAGLDWPSQVRAMALSGLSVTIYCTWLDAPSQGTSLAQIPPIAYLSTLATKYGLPLAGENTGGGGSSALSVSFARFTAYHLVGLMYMSGDMIATARAGTTLGALKSKATAALAQS
jgi:hypothetical protein